MKSFVFLATLVLFTSNTHAQKGVKLGLQFTPGVSLALNNEDLDKGETLDAQAAFAFNTGITFGYGITEIFSISTGVSYSQHTASFVHNRAKLASGLTDINLGKKFSRVADYIRVPLLLSISSDPNRAAGFFARVGPHFDFLVNAVYKDARLEGYSRYNSATGINLRDDITIYQKNTSGAGLLSSGKKGKTFNDFTIGVTADLGVQIRINDFLQLTALLHFEASSNPDGPAAASFAHNLTQGDYLVTSNPLSSPVAASADATKIANEGTPFDATFPNYTSESDPFATHRNPTWNIMAGFQIGLVYTYRKH